MKKGWILTDGARNGDIDSNGQKDVADADSNEHREQDVGQDKRDDLVEDEGRCAWLGSVNARTCFALVRRCVATATSANRRIDFVGFPGMDALPNHAR